jgi:hypothetical protein
MGKPVLLERKAGFASIRMRDQLQHFVDLPPYYRKLFMHEPLTSSTAEITSP